MSLPRCSTEPGARGKRQSARQTRGMRGTSVPMLRSRGEAMLAGGEGGLPEDGDQRSPVDIRPDLNPPQPPGGFPWALCSRGGGMLAGGEGVLAGDPDQRPAVDFCHGLATPKPPGLFPRAPSDCLQQTMRPREASPFRCACRAR